MTRDVVAVSLSNFRVRLMATGKTVKDAEAVIGMAVMRRGCEEEFFVDVPHGRYRDGDSWIRAVK